MYINTNTIISVSEANQNFSHATRIAKEYREAILFKNNRPRYLLIDSEKSQVIEILLSPSGIFVDLSGRWYMHYYTSIFLL